MRKQGRPTIPKRVLLASIAIAISMPAHAASCEIAEILSGEIRFDIATVIKIPGKYPPKKGGEYAIIRANSHNHPRGHHGAFLGEMDWDRSGFLVRDVPRTKELAHIPLPMVAARPAHITPKLVVYGLDDGCEKPSRLVIRPVRTGVYKRSRYGVYEVLNGNTPVGTIEGRFPENPFGVR